MVGLNKEDVMAVESFSVSEVVEQAVRTEHLGYEFYTGMAEKFKEENKELSALFTTLAAKEQVHEQKYRELHEVVGEEIPEGWEDVSEYMRTFVESEFFLGAGEKALVKMKAVDTMADAVEFALNFEKETLLYFLGLKEAVKQKDVVDEIIIEERSHIMWLNKFKRNNL